ncbi:MAG: CueP family metal-binding protein [Actinomycetes bacterium]|nr:CueP family metal-binding protein [Actinomycetes bacterium]
MRKMLFAAAAVAMVTVSGCAGTAPEETTPEETAQAEFLAPYGLEDSSAEEIVTALDRTNEDREAGLAGSVRYDTVVFATPGGETELPLPDDLFYLSLAPYVENTHDCYYHNLASCQGELVGEDLEVTIIAADGEVHVDGTVTTYDNGFVGFWLPRDIEGTISVTWDGLSATAPIATGPDDPTCVTTLQLG